MKTLAFLQKTFLENLREWKILILALAFAPFFVYLMWAYMTAADPAYRLLVRNSDLSSQSKASSHLVESWRKARHSDGSPVFEVEEIDNLEQAKNKLEKRDADLIVEIPALFGDEFERLRADRKTGSLRLINYANRTDSRSSMAMALSDYAAYTYVYEACGLSPPLEVEAKFVGGKTELSDFDLYVPSLLVLSLIMVLFTAAATLIKEVDKKTMTRLMLSKLTTPQMLSAISLNQVLIATASLALTFLSAFSVGYRTSGSLALVIAVGALSALSVVALSILVAAFLKSIFELLTIGCFPFFILMFFSDCMMPLPKIRLLDIAGRALYLNDVLPTSLTVRAFNKVLNFGAGPGDIAFELGILVLLTAFYFAVGTWAFKRRHQMV